MIEIGKKSKLHFHWKVNPYDFSKEKENSLLTKISLKYSIPKEKVKIIPEFIMVNSDGEKVSLSNEVITNIQNPSFQLKLFNDYLVANNIKDYDFDLIKKIDAEINSKINYEVYDKFKQYSIKWVKWKNFLSYGDNNHFDFTHLSDLVLLNGEPANQSGKTTFAIDLLHFLLFGKTSKAATQDKIFNKHLPEATEVVVEGCINIDGIDYVIKRTLKRPSLQKRSSRSKTVQKVEYYKIVGDSKEELVEYIDNQQEENSIQTNKVIKDAIGNESDFDMIICATASNLDELIEKKETDRGRLLSRWIGLLPIEEKDIIAREKFNSEVKRYLVCDKYNVEELKRDISLFKKNIETFVTEVERFTKQNEEIEKQVKLLEESKNNLFSLKTKINDDLLKVDHNTLTLKLNKLLEEGKKKGQEITNLEEEYKQYKDKDFSVNEYEEQVEKLSSLKVSLAEITEKYKHTTSLIETIKKSEYCPTCGRRYEGVDNSAKISELEKESASFVEEGKEVRRLLNETENKIEKLKVLRDEYTKKNQLEIKKSSLEVNLSMLRSEYKDTKHLLDEYNKNNEAIDNNNKLDIEIRNTQSKITNYRNTFDLNNRETESLKYRIKDCEKEISTRNELISRILEEEKLVRNWRIYLDMIGKNGISKMVLRKTLPIINAQISYLLNDVCDFTVEITINDKNDIMFYLVKDGVYSDLTSGSGFERTASSLALRIVLGNISTLPRANFIVLDELWGRVANENLDNVRTLLNKVSDKYQFLLEISHLDQIKDWHSEIITIKKEGNVSKITSLKK